MNCPNCGLQNAPGARFCANCGTGLDQAPPAGGQSYSNQGYTNQPYSPPGRSGFTLGGRPMTPARTIGLGCLIIVLLFFFFGLSCMRACFFPRHYYRVYQHRR